jgi:hypothetical protein
MEERKVEQKQYRFNAMLRQLVKEVPVYAYWKILCDGIVLNLGCIKYFFDRICKVYWHLKNVKFNGSCIFLSIHFF